MTDLNHTPEYATQKNLFDAYYETTLKPILKQNDNIRRRYLLSFTLLLLMVSVFYPYLLYQLLCGTIPSQYIGLILCASGVLTILMCGPIYFYKKKVKPQIMPDFANFFGDFTYTFEGKVNDEVLRASELFGKYDIIVGDDFFSGVYDGVHISIGEQKLKQIRYEAVEQNIFSGENNRTVKRREKCIFSGICILFEMNKNFKGRTIVLKDKGALGNALTRIKGLQNVRLEDSRFEKVFEVYSDDQVEARYLLTTAFMERMLKLRDLYDGKAIQFCFNRNKLLLSIPTKQNMFEANSFFCSNLNKKKIDLVFEQFYTIFSIVNLLKLNQHIGM